MSKELFEDLIVVKRSGQRVIFTPNKIAIVIKKAFESVRDRVNINEVNDIYNKVLSKIETEFKDRKTINVEDIQDVIENILSENNINDVYVSFSEYRLKRSESRNVFKQKQEHKFSSIIEKINLSNILDSNTTMTANKKISSLGKMVIDEYADAYLIDNKYLKAIEDGSIEIDNRSSIITGNISDTNLNLLNFFENHSTINELKDYLIDIRSEIDGIISINSIDIILRKWLLKHYKKLIIYNIEKFLKYSGFIDFINLEKIENLISKCNYINNIIDILKNYQTNEKIRELFNISSNDSIELLKNILENNILDLLINLDKYENYDITFGKISNDDEKIVLNIIINIISNHHFDNINFIYKLYDKDNILKLIQKKNKIYLLNTKLNNLEYFSNGLKVYENYINNSSSIGRFAISKCTLNLPRIALKLQEKNIKNFFINLDNELEFIKNYLLQIFEIIGNKTNENYKYLFRGNIETDDKLQEDQKIRKVLKNNSLVIGLVGLYDCVYLLNDANTKSIDEIKKYIEKKLNDFSISNKVTFIIYENENFKTRKDLLDFDKSIYGDNDYIKNLDVYTLTNKLCSSNLKFSGGSLNKVLYDDKNIIDKIDELVSNGVEFIRIIYEDNS